MPRIAVDVDAFVEDLFAEFGLAAGSGERTAPFFSTASIEAEREEPEQICDCLWLEYRGINAGFENARVTSVECFANRFVGNTRGIEFRHIEVITKKIPGTRAVRCSGGGCQ